MKKNNSKFWLSITCILTLVVMEISGFLQVMLVNASTPYNFSFNSTDVAENGEIQLLSSSNTLIIEKEGGINLTNATIKWKSSASEVVEIVPDPDYPGYSNIVRLNRLGPGYSDITAIITDSSSTYTINCKVKVDYNIDVNGTGFKEITTNHLRALVFDDIGAANAVMVNLSYTNDFATPIGSNPSVTWKSDNENIVTFDKTSGKVVPVGAGMTTMKVYTNSVSQNVSPLIKEFNVIVSPKAVNPDGTDGVYLSNFTMSYDKSVAHDHDIKTNTTYTTDLIWKFYDSSNVEITNTTDKIDYTLNSNPYININNARAGTYYIRGFVSASYIPSDFNSAFSVPYLTIKLDVPVKIANSDIIMNVGNTYDIYKNTNIPSATAYNYTSANPTIADVDNKGVITAKSQGTTTITMSNSNATENYQFKVTVIDGIALDYTAVKIYTSGTISLHATTTSSNPRTWTTDNPAVATVSTNGLVTGVTKGTAVVTVSQTINGVVKSASCTINVQQSVNKITIDPATVAISINDYKTLKAVIEPVDLNNVSLTWTSSDPTIAKITDTQDLTATIQGLKGGTVIITAINQENVVVGYCTVTVKKIVDKITLSDTAVTVQLAKKTYQLKGYVSPDDATNKNINWTTTNSSVATVDANGLVTLKSAGSVSIIATSEDSPSVMAICNMTVQVSASAIALDTKTKTMYVGESAKLGYVITPSNAADKDITWSSSNSSVASVDASGLVSAKGAGQAIIIAKTAGGLMDTCTITVKQDVTGISFDVKSLELYVDQSYTIKVTPTPSTATDYTLKWTSSDTTIATVDDKGKVTGKGMGKAIISAKTSNGTVVYCNITVKEQVTGLQLNYTKKSIVIDESFKLKATIKPSSAANDVTVKWTSSNANVAKVNTAGTVTGLKGGTAIITCKTSDGKFIEYCIVTVVERVTSVKLNKTSYKLGLNKSYTLIASVKTNAATDPTIKWTSSNSRIASVDSKGKVTGKTLGTVTIKATAKDGSGEYAICTVRVVKAVTSIKLSKSSYTTVEGRSFTLKAKVSPSNASFKTVNWSSSDEKIAIVDADGEVTALAEGTVTIKAAAKDTSGKSAYCYVIVQKRTPANSVTIINQNLTMVVGETTTVQKAINPTNSTDRYTWESDNKTVASVNSATGKVTARTPGIANVTVMTESGKTATTKITVVGLNSTNLVLEQYSTYQLYVIGLTSGITWDVEDNEIATVSGGLITSKRIGTTNIIATVNGRRLTCKLKVVKIN